MTEIAIKPITGEDINGKLEVVQETVHLPYVAPVLEDWASLVVSKSILGPEDSSEVSEDYRLGKQEVHARLDELIAEQEGEAVDLAYIGLFGDIGCCSLRYVLEQARRKMVSNPSLAKWPAPSMTDGLVLETAKTICLVESFDELLDAQPKGTVMTTYQKSPQLAKSSALEYGDGLWSPPGFKELVIPTYSTITRAYPTSNGTPKAGLTEDLSINVAGIIEAIDRDQFQPIENLVKQNIHLDREPVFFGVLPEDAEWVAPEGMSEPLRGLHEARFELVRAASARALKAYTEGW